LIKHDGEIILSIARKGDRLAAFPPLITYLASYPDPQSVTEALLRGPLKFYEAVACNIMMKDKSENYALTIIGTSGITERTVQRYQELPLNIDTPMGRAFLDSEIVTTSITEMVDEYPAVHMDSEIWSEQVERSGNQIIVCAPIVSNGQAVGAFNFYLPPENPLGPSDFSFTQGLSALLGMWLTHPQTKSGLPIEPLDEKLDTTLILSHRQLEILGLVAQGRSNAAIAVCLGYSQSTVKQELQKAMRALRVNDRLEAANRALELGFHAPANE
jgi:DNA-binding CsgD family transcriptional regulator